MSLRSASPKAKMRDAAEGASVKDTKRPRDIRAAERREAILAAALDEFSLNGFAATRLDDIAKRAGVAKGTLYLYFRDKETMFQELIRTTISPIIATVEDVPAQSLALRDLAEMLLGVFVREILGTKRKNVIRLMIAEGPRFPKLAEFYYREVLGRVIPALGKLISQTSDDNVVRQRALAQFPQLLVAPALLALVWGSLFEKYSPLDVEAFMRAHLNALFGERKVS